MNSKSTIYFKKVCHLFLTEETKIRPSEKGKYNSPWNIAADFNIEMGFFPHEIVPMLDDYKADKGVKMDSQKIADKLYYYTNGYSFFVSKLCKIIDEEFLHKKTNKEWTEQDVTDAVRELIQRNNTNFDSMIKSLENSKELYDLVYQILVENDTLIYNAHDPLIQEGMTYGLFRKGGLLKIHNLIYQEVLYNYITSKVLKNEAAYGFKEI